MHRESQHHNVRITLILAFTVLLVFAFGTFVNAQGTDSTLRQTLEEKRESYEQSREPIGERRMESESASPLGTEDFKTKMAERRAALSPRVKERVHNLFDNVVMRLEALVNRFEQISTRLESRINKTKASGADTATAESHFRAARVSLSEATASLKIVKETNLNSIVDADSPSEQFRSLRTAIIGIRENLRRTHDALIRTALALKNTTPVVPEVNETDDETATTSDLIN